MKKTVVIGVSKKPERYSYLAVERLKKHGHEVVAIGLKEGDLNGTPIQTGMPIVKDVDTVSLYINPINQESLYDYILSLKPARVIFNPGTENEFFEKMLAEKGIETEEACTLTLLATGQF